MLFNKLSFVNNRVKTMLALWVLLLTNVFFIWNVFADPDPDPDPVEQVTVTYYYEWNEYQTVQVDKWTKRSALTLKTIDDTQFCWFYTTADWTSTFSFWSTAINEDLNIYWRKCSVTILDEEDNVIKEKYYVDKNTILADPTDEFLTTYPWKCFYFATSKTASRTTFSATAPKITSPKVYYLINKDCTYDIYMNWEKVDTKEFTRWDVVADFTNEYKATNENLAWFYTSKTSNVLFDFTQSQLYPFAVYWRDYNIEIDWVKTVWELTKDNIMWKQVKLLEDKEMSWIFYRHDLKNNEQVNINLNWHTLTMNWWYFNVYYWSVTITWPWKIIVKWNAWAFQMYWQTTNNWKTATLNIWEWVEIESTSEKWIPVWINPKPNSTIYWVTVDIFWKITATHELWFAIYVNWSATNTDAAPQIHLREWSEISNPNWYAIYLAWYNETTVEDNVKVTWKQAAIEIRAWILDIDWWEFTSTATSTFEQANWNWTSIWWAAIAVSQHSTNKPLEVNITWWKFTWIRSIYEKDLQWWVTDNIKLNITWWEFNWEVYSQNVTEFIAWWIYSNNPLDSYIVPWKDAVLNSEWKYIIDTESDDNATVTYNLDWWVFAEWISNTVKVAKWWKLTSLETPTKADVEFIWWYKEDWTLFDFVNETINDNLTLVAHYWYKLSYTTNVEWQNIEDQLYWFTDVTVKPTDPVYTWHVFKYWYYVTQDWEWKDVENEFTFWEVLTWSLNLIAKYNQTAVIKFVNDDWTELQTWEVEYWVVPTYTWATPTKLADSNYTYTFKSWDSEIVAVDWEKTYTATYNSTKKNNSSWWWSSSSSSSSSTSNSNKDNKTDNNDTDINTNTADPDTNTEEETSNEVVENDMYKDIEPIVDEEWNVTIKEYNIPNYNKDLPVEKQITDNWFSVEMNDAYKFAFENWITTMESIEDSNMNWSLTRIAMAKMLVYYAINILWLEPDASRVKEFPDVSEQLDEDYNNAVTLAYQLWIMWIWIDNFRPFDEVPRSEFVTALSRMLFNTPDWENKYYETHMKVLKDKWIITNDNPELKELRWYVMLMLMRSAN